MQALKERQYRKHWLLAHLVIKRLSTVKHIRKTCFLKGGGHANFDAEFFVPMDSLGDAQVKNNTFKLLKFHLGAKINCQSMQNFAL